PIAATAHPGRCPRRQPEFHRGRRRLSARAKRPDPRRPHQRIPQRRLNTTTRRAGVADLRRGRTKSQHCLDEGRRSMVAPNFIPWTYPDDRYYYGWYGQPWHGEPTDGDIKAAVVERLRVNPFTKDDDLTVDVKKKVVILTGDVS